MRNFKMMLMVLAMSSSAVMAQDYYAPTDKEKEPVARFPLSEIKVKTRPNGEKFIKYELPALLTGEVNTIEATQVDVNGVPNGVRIFSEDKATVTCMGTDENPGCMVTHQKLALNKNKAYAAIDNAYFDPQTRANAKVVVDEFHDPVAHSGNQPIGILGGLKDRNDTFVPRGTMKTFFARTNGVVNSADIVWVVNQVDRKDVLHSEAQFNVKGFNNPGKLYNIKRFGNRVIGMWEIEGQSGWFEFNFNTNKNRFEGVFGDYRPNSVPDQKKHITAGVWYSQAQ